MAHKVRVQQYRGPRDLLERLVRDLRALQQATTAAAALDCAITYCCTAWGLTNWLFMPVARDASLRRQLARAADRGMASIDATINLDGYEAWRVCPQFAAGIAAPRPRSMVSFGSFGCSRPTANRLPTAVC
jgi:hypothetical protein